MVLLRRSCGCHHRRQAIEAIMAAWIGGCPAELGEALSRGGDLLAAARMPLIGGLAGDVDAIRAAYGLAAKLGAAMDPAGSAALYADLAVVAAAGAMTTTPAEALGRADMVLAVGRAAACPLLAEFCRRGPSRGRAAGEGRSIAAIGPLPAMRAAGAGDGRALHAAVASAALPVALSVLRALAAGRDVTPPVAPALHDIAAMLGRARFGAVLYDPGELGELGVDMLMGLTKDLNAATRFDALSLGGDGQSGEGKSGEGQSGEGQSGEGQSGAVVMVGVWTTGDGPRVGFGRGFPEHDPWRFEASRLVASGEADAGLWLAALAAPPPAWCKEIATLALIGDARASAASGNVPKGNVPRGDEAEIVIAVAVPGETAPGVVWDERRATLVHRPARAGAGGDADGRGIRPGAADILNRIGRVIDARRASSC
jgi:formylmethanofuran dehydrogenase subunit B